MKNEIKSEIMKELTIGLSIDTSEAVKRIKEDIENAFKG